MKMKRVEYYSTLHDEMRQNSAVLSRIESEFFFNVIRAKIYLLKIKYYFPFTIYL
jgi:hypothetical protein